MMAVPLAMSMSVDVLVLSWEDWSSAQHFCEDATDRPNINGLGVSNADSVSCHLCVHSEREHDLWRTVPSSCHV